MKTRLIIGAICTILPAVSVAGVSSTHDNKSWKGVVISPSFFSVGSGVPVSKCHVLTNEHVVRHNREPGIKYSGYTYDSELVARDDSNDLALLKVEDCPFKNFAKVANKAPQVGETLTSTYYRPGFNFSNNMTRTSGRFIGYKKILIKNEFIMDSMLIDDKRPRPGASGGGVSSKSGLVSVIFGVATKFSEPKTYAVNYKALKKFLDKHVGGV